MIDKNNYLSRYSKLDILLPFECYIHRALSYLYAILPLQPLAQTWQRASWGSNIFSYTNLYCNMFNKCTCLKSCFILVTVYTRCVKKVQWILSKNKRYKFSLLPFKIIAIRYNTHLTTFIQLPETISKGLLWNRSQNDCHAIFDGIHVRKTWSFDGHLQVAKQEEVRKSQLRV